MIEKFWNNKHPLGLIIAFIAMLNSILFKILDSSSTVLWKFNFKKFEDRSKVLSFVSIRYPGNIEIGKKSIIGRRVFLSTEISSAILIIGNNTQLNQNVKVDFSGNVKIGSNVVVSSSTHIYSHSHGYNPKSQAIGKPLDIKDNVWIGSGCYIMDSVEYIGEGAIIGTGAIVTRNVEPYTIVGGNPARLIKKIKPEL